MPKAVFTLICDWSDDEFRSNLLANCPKNAEIFTPICDENVQKGNITLKKAISLLQNGKEKDLLSGIISEFENIQAEFVVVIGGILPQIDEKIARNLGVPFVLSDKTAYLKNVLNSPCITEFGQIQGYKNECVTPLVFELNLLKRVKKLNKTIVFPESDDERVLRAADFLIRAQAVKIIFLGRESEVLKKASDLGLNLSDARFIDPENSEYLSDFANTFFELRKHKGLNLTAALETMKDRIYFATMLVHKGIASAMVGGASTTTTATIRPALQFIKTKPAISVVSGSFIMCLEDRIWIFADCAICPNPSSDELAQIAIATAQTAREFGFEPRVAMLSYSTGESGFGPDVEFVKEALKKARTLASELQIDGPMQFDAAVDLSVAEKKMPDSKVAGRANVFIFPNLNCANIAYKAVQRSANAVAIGPILQGLNKPINDLSRGCLVEDIVNTALISALQGE